MTMDLTGVTLAKEIVIALNIPAPPTNPTSDQEAAYQSAVQAQIATWTTICNQMLTYISANAVVSTPNITTGVDTGTGTIS